MKHKQNRYNMHLRLYMAAQTPQDHRHSCTRLGSASGPRAPSAQVAKHESRNTHPFASLPADRAVPPIRRAPHAASSDLYTFMFIFDLNK
jgi:hypothetical protein